MKWPSTENAIRFGNYASWAKNGLLSFSVPNLISTQVIGSSHQINALIKFVGMNVRERPLHKYRHLLIRRINESFITENYWFLVLVLVKIPKNHTVAKCQHGQNSCSKKCIAKMDSFRYSSFCEWMLFCTSSWNAELITCKMGIWRISNVFNMLWFASIFSRTLAYRSFSSFPSLKHRDSDQTIHIWYLTRILITQPNKHINWVI